MLPKQQRELNRLNDMDREEAAIWHHDLAGSSYGMTLCIDPDAEDDVGDFLLVYRLTLPFTAWGIARRGDHVLVWRCADGADIATFATIDDAMACLFDEQAL